MLWALFQSQASRLHILGNYNYTLVLQYMKFIIFMVTQSCNSCWALLCSIRIICYIKASFLLSWSMHWLYVHTYMIKPSLQIYTNLTVVVFCVLSMWSKHELHTKIFKILLCLPVMLTLCSILFLSIICSNYADINDSIQFIEVVIGSKYFHVVYCYEFIMFC